MNYRKEIEGLRAIAVIPVILFHAGYGWFSGGFVGVDIFFVISGYLITSIILGDLQRGTFSLLQFYERRARRILPALYLVLFATMPFAWMWMMSNDLQTFSASLMAVVTYISNIFFWRGIGYFTPNAELAPLLHTWSLAVEEQYYVLFPAFLLAIWRFGWRWMAVVLAVIAVASFSAAEWAVSNKPVAGFFLLPSRAFELLIGSLLACWLNAPSDKQAGSPINDQASREILAVLGVLLVAISIFGFDKSVPFPSRYALVPTLGTALIIAAATADTLVGRLLSSPVLAGFGAISYSLYLWHQPLFAFARIRLDGEPATWLKPVLIAAAVGLAYLSWRFVERPFRNRQQTSRSTILVSSVATSALLLCIGLAGYFTQGFGFRTFADGQTYSQLAYQIRPNHGLGDWSGQCTEGFTVAAACRTSDNPEIVVWGDSYAAHLVPGLAATLKDVGVIQLTKTGCGPFIAIAPYNHGYYNSAFGRECLAFNDKVLKWILSTPTIKYVVLASQFEQYVSEAEQFMTANGPVPRDIILARSSLTSALDSLAARGITPVVIGPTPMSPQSVGATYVREKFFGTPRASFDFPQSYSDEKQRSTFELLSGLQDTYRVVDLGPYFCTGGICRPVIGNTPLYVDTGHLTYDGSTYLARRIDYPKLFGMAR